MKLAFGDGIHATEIEVKIQKHQEVKATLIEGVGKPGPFVIIELASNTALSEDEMEARLASIWPYINRVNERCAKEV